MTEDEFDRAWEGRAGVSESLERDKELIRAAASMVIDAITDLVYADPHQWSKRPCQTGRTITELAGRPFGCDRYRERLVIDDD